MEGGSYEVRRKGAASIRSKVKRGGAVKVMYVNILLFEFDFNLARPSYLSQKHQNVLQIKGEIQCSANVRLQCSSRTRGHNCCVAKHPFPCQPLLCNHTEKHPPPKLLHIAYIMLIPTSSLDNYEVISCVLASTHKVLPCFLINVVF